MAQLPATSETSRSGNTAIIYDATILDNTRGSPVDQLFDEDYHTNNARQQNQPVPGDAAGHSGKDTGDQVLGKNAGTGRAKVRYFKHHGLNLVFKHYYRGGLIALLVKDRYLAADPEATRAFREYRLLKLLHDMGLPVPVAIAARAEKMPLLPFSRCELVTREIPNVITLSDYLSGQALPQENWQEVGAMIRQFHNNSVYHADLNARNILLEIAQEKATGKVYLVDFDKSSIRYCASQSLDETDLKAPEPDTIDGWKADNLSRLQRSLNKFKRMEPGFNFRDSDWNQLLAGYRA